LIILEDETTFYIGWIEVFVGFGLRGGDWIKSFGLENLFGWGKLARGNVIHFS